MSDVTIIIIDGSESRKNLKAAMPESIRKVFDSVGRDVEMESGEQIKDKLPAGFPRAFVQLEEVLFFPPSEEESEPTKKRRRGMRELNNRRRRIKTAGNTEA